MERTVWISDTAAIIQGSENHPVMEGILVDISERKLMEMQSQQARTHGSGWADWLAELRMTSTIC